MASLLSRLRTNPWYERVYKIGVAVKGFDGTVELLAGLWLWFAPGSLHHILTSWQGELLESRGFVGQYIAHSLDKVNHELYGGVMVMAIVFLVSHGVIKLALVYALLKEILWAYPYALFVLVLFLLAQIVAMIQHPGIGMAVLMLLDILIIWLVWGEWQKLKLERVHKKKTS